MQARAYILARGLRQECQRQFRVEPRQGILPVEECGLVMIHFVQDLLDARCRSPDETLRERIALVVGRQVQQQLPVHLDLFNRVRFDSHHILRVAVDGFQGQVAHFGSTLVEE